MRREKSYSMLEEIVEIIRADVTRINKWYKKHPYIPYEWRKGDPTQ